MRTQRTGLDASENPPWNHYIVFCFGNIDISGGRVGRARLAVVCSYGFFASAATSGGCIHGRTGILDEYYYLVDRDVHALQCSCWQVDTLHSSQSDIPHDDMRSHLQPASLEEQPHLNVKDYLCASMVALPVSGKRFLRTPSDLPDGVPVHGLDEVSRC